jgi:osmotically-inducible protein OsmY
MLISRNKRKCITLTALAVALPSGLGACHPQPPSDKTGHAIGQAVQQPDQAAGEARLNADQDRATLAEKPVTSGDSAADATLAVRVKAALIVEPSIKGMNIDVESKDGIVSLFGTVDNLAHRDKLTQVASAVEGVRSVLNNVKIISGS